MPPQKPVNLVDFIVRLLLKLILIIFLIEFVASWVDANLAVVTIIGLVSLTLFALGRWLRWKIRDQPRW